MGQLLVFRVTRIPILFHLPMLSSSDAQMLFVEIMSNVKSNVKLKSEESEE